MEVSTIALLSCSQPGEGSGPHHEQKYCLTKTMAPPPSRRYIIPISILFDRTFSDSRLNVHGNNEIHAIIHSEIVCGFDMIDLSFSKADL